MVSRLSPLIRTPLIQVLVLTVMMLATIRPLFAEMIAEAQPREIDVMQSVQLQVRVTGTDDVEGLDLAPLTTDFDVEATSTQSQLRVVNGAVTSWVDLLVTLRPKRTGQLTIPALTLGNERSQPLTITVRAVASTLQDEINKLVYFDISVDRSEVFVQAQLRYTRRLYYTTGVQIYGDLPGPPAIDNAVVLPLGETTQDITMRNDTRYGVLEQRYAIFPERSGQLTIPGFSVQSSVRLNNVRRGVQVQAEDQTVNVLPIPATWPADKPWFPAAALELDDDWSPDVTSIRAGESLRRSITVVAGSNTGSAIPPPSTTFTSPLMRQYPETPQLEDDSRGDSVTGRLTQNDSFVPSWGGTVEIPAVEITWWDTQARQVRLTRLPARQLTIAGAPPPALATDTPETVDTPLPASSASSEASGEDDSDTLRWWPIVVGVCTVFLAVIAALRLRRQPTPAADWFSSARSATRSGNLQMLKDALIRGAMVHYAAPRQTALQKLAIEPEWQALIAADNARFAAQGPNPTTKQVMQNSLELARRLKKAAKLEPQSILPPLYSSPGHGTSGL